MAVAPAAALVEGVREDIAATGAMAPLPGVSLACQVKAAVAAAVVLKAAAMAVVAAGRASWVRAPVEKAA